MVSGMRFAVIENGKVANVVKATPEHAASKGWVELPQGAGRGWLYDGEEFSPPEPEPETIPTVVTRRQILTALGALGWITTEEAEAALTTGARPAAVDAVINAMPEELRFGARMKWAGFQHAYRDDVMVTALAFVEDKTDEDVDALFEMAAGID